MDDLISRQAAIEAMTADNLNRNLDSVHDDDMKRAARAAQRALARLPAAQRWVPVTERLPRPYDVVLGTDGYDVGTVAFQAKSGDWLADDSFSDYTPDITHWMPLPELPKEEL